MTIKAMRMARKKGTPYWLKSSPVVSPAMVEKVAWARLTMPPMPVTTTKDKKMSERARPWAIVPAQKSSARKRMYTTRKAVAATQGAARRHMGSSVRYSSGGTSSAADPPRRLRSRARINRAMISATMGTESANPAMSTLT